MNKIEALKVFGLNGEAEFEDIKRAYRKACSLYHPDRNPAGLEMMKVINAAWLSLSDYVKGSVKVEEASTINYSEELNAALNAIIHFGLKIEICGNWIWVSGETKPYKEQLKEAGFRWAPKKMMWHFRPSDYKSFNRGKWSMDEIRERHGSVTVKGKVYEQLRAAS